MHILIYWACFLAGIIAMALWQYFVKGRFVNFFYALCVIADALLDVGCQLWIDISGIFRRRKKVALDESEKFYHS